MTEFPLTSLITLFTVLLMFATSVNVGKARIKYKIAAPAVTGHEVFDRAYRVQMNTLEAATMLLPALWIYTIFVGDKSAFILGMIWLTGRVWYAIAYQINPAKRGPGFGIGFLASAALWIGAIGKVMMTLLH